MKKTILAVVCVIALCGVLTATLLLQPSFTFPSTPQSTAQNPVKPTPQTTPESSSPSTPQEILQPTLPKNTTTGNSYGLRQINPQPPLRSDQKPIQRPTNRTLQEAVGNATNYFEQTQEPYALLILNMLYRRFGVTEFSDSLQQYDQLLVDNPENAALLRIFRRIADYNNPVQTADFDAVIADVDQITVPALYSDRLALPGNYLLKLTNAAKSGDYLLTHTLLATLWLQDNHYDLPLSNDFKESLYRANAELIGNDSEVNDLEMEAAAFLYAAGQGALVSDAFVQRVIAAQNYDGGWTCSTDVPVGSDWHASAVGLMLLLHVEFTADSYPPWLAPATYYEGGCLNPLTVPPIAFLLFIFVIVRNKTKQFGFLRPRSQWLVK